MTAAAPSVAYKVLTSSQMAELVAAGVFNGSPIDLADGFVHLSTSKQLDETVARHFAGQTGLHVAAVDLAGLAGAVRWEQSRGGDLFPHLYAALPLGAVIAHGPLEYTDDGTILLPFPAKGFSSQI